MKNNNKSLAVENEKNNKLFTIGMRNKLLAIGMRDNKKAMEMAYLIGLLLAIALGVAFIFWLIVLKGNLGEGGNLLSDLFKGI